MNKMSIRIVAIFGMAFMAAGTPSRATAAPTTPRETVYLQVCNTAWVHVCYLCQCPSEGFTDHCYCLAMSVAYQKPTSGVTVTAMATSTAFDAAKTRKSVSAKPTPESAKATDLATAAWRGQAGKNKTAPKP